MVDENASGKKKTHPPKKMGQENEEDILPRIPAKKIERRKPGVETADPTRLSVRRC
jgi:hypothetical protein